MPMTILLNGPTASGKSALGVRLAEKYNGVIINADSMQLYNALATLTAQPSEKEKSHVLHKLYGFLDPADKTDAVSWRNMAIREIKSTHENGQLPIVLGGTGFYIKTLTEGLSPIPPVPHDIRAQGEAQLAEQGLESFYDKLVAQDPMIKGAIDPQNPRRVMRAWEVFHTTGKSLKHWQSLPKSGPPEGVTFKKIALLPPRDIIYQRCDARFKNMLDTGAVEEARDLNLRIDAGHVPPDALITKAIGFSQITDFLNDKIDKETAITNAQQATRNYAKRQTTWLNNQFNADVIFTDPVQADISNI